MKRLLLLLIFLPVFVNAQVKTLSNLSRGQLYSYDEIKDADNNIRGYLLLFMTDKIAKETYELEYVVLDENLDKVTNGFITEMKFESWISDAKSIGVEADLYQDKLLLEFTDQFEGYGGAYARYRFLDLKTNKLSDPFIFNKGEMKLNPELNRKMKGYRDNISESVMMWDGIGMVVKSTSINKKAGLTEQYYVHLDENFAEKWRWTFDDEGVKNKRRNNPYALRSDDEVIVLWNRFSKQNGMNLNDYSIIFLSSQSGKVINEFQLPDVDKFAYKPVDTKILDDKIILMGNFSKKTDYGNISDENNLGLFRFEFDKKTGRFLKSHYLNWPQIAGKIPVNEKGYVKKEGYLYIHDMLSLEDGNTVVVAETFEQQPVITNNMYFMLLDDKMNAKEVFEVAKFRNKFPGVGLHSSNIKAYGLFDFMAYQTMGDDEYLFYLNDNEKKSKNRKKSTLFGIVSYADGKFSRQTLDLKTETSTIYAMNAKKGYLLLIENFDEKGKQSELRLEKINY